MWCYHVSEFYSKHTRGPIYVVLQMTAAGTTDDSKYSCIIIIAKIRVYIGSKFCILTFGIQYCMHCTMKLAK